MGVSIAPLPGPHHGDAWTEHYLSEAKSGSSYSAWVAGEMLGQHWDPKEAVPILVSIARDGPFAAGRRGALHGLAHALGRSPKPLARHIMLCLEYVKGDDRSRSVREYAALIVHGQDACSGYMPYSPNAMDRVQTRTDPRGKLETYAYDPNGNLLSVTDARGKVTGYALDAMEPKACAAR